MRNAFACNLEGRKDTCRRRGICSVLSPKGAAFLPQSRRQGQFSSGADKWNNANFAEKKIFNFSLQDIKNLAKEFLLQTRYEGNFDGTMVFDAKGDEHLSLKYLESGLDKPPGLGRVILSANLSNVNPETYGQLIKVGETLSKKEGYDLLIQPEGDLDSVNLIEHPEYYKLKNQKEAIERLQKAGRKVVFSVSLRADNMRYQLDQIKRAMLQLKEMQSELKRF